MMNIQNIGEIAIAMMIKVVPEAAVIKDLRKKKNKSSKSKEKDRKHKKRSHNSRSNSASMNSEERRAMIAQWN